MDDSGATSDLVLTKLQLPPVQAGALTAVAGLTALMSAGASAAPSHHIAQKTCFWSNEIDSTFDMSAAHNHAFPDSGAVYWTADVTMPGGSKIVLDGQFPHARYESLNTYNATTHAATDNLHDVGTVPDKGSTNPFVVGANRNATKRSYTATIVNQPPPARRRTRSTPVWPAKPRRSLCTRSTSRIRSAPRRN